MCCQDFRHATYWPCGPGGFLNSSAALRTVSPRLLYQVLPPRAALAHGCVYSETPVPEACPSTLASVPAMGKLTEIPRLCWQGSLRCVGKYMAMVNVSPAHPFYYLFFHSAVCTSLLVPCQAFKAMTLFRSSALPSPIGALQ